MERPFLFVFLTGSPTESGAADKYGKQCLLSRWGCGDVDFVLLSRHDVGKLVNGNNTTLAKACGQGFNTQQGSYAYFPDTARNRAVLSRHNVPFTPCATFSEAFALRPNG